MNNKNRTGTFRGAYFRKVKSAILALAITTTGCSDSGSPPDTENGIDADSNVENQTPELAAANNVSDVDRSTLFDSLTALQEMSGSQSSQARLFTSHISKGFSGTVLNDGSISLDWQDSENIDGYLLYRDSQYLTTIFESNYIDKGAPGSDSHYYEVTSFDHNEVYRSVAVGLTVRLKHKAVSLPTHIKDDYELVFADEFNGTALDTSKWNTRYLWGTDLVINEELQYYVDIANQPDFGHNPFTVANGELTIQAMPTPQHLLAQANQQPYLSGLITSYDSFKFTYGYIETRAQLPVGKGLWAAFWLLNAYYVDRKPEIDIMEHLGHELDRVFHTYHYYDSDGNLHSTESQSSTGSDFTGEFHTFAVEWRPGTLIFYIDGKERHRLTDFEVSDQRMYILANLAVGGWWPGTPDETTPFPASYKIDYIRAYQRRGPMEVMPLFDATPTIPLSNELRISSPNHLPPYELWPQGYPER